MPSDSDETSRHDVVVIGAGPAGEAAAELGGSLGYSVALVERDIVGGTVVTSGGAPTKTFREAAVYLSSFEKEKIYGVALSAPPEVMYPAIRARAQEVSERLRQATLERIRERGVHLVQGAARLEPGTRWWPAPAAARRPGCTPSASSSRPGRARCGPPTCPSTIRASLTPRPSRSIARRPRELLIVGGGAIGVEYATIFSALGVPVTILDAAPRLAAMMDDEISRRLEQVFLARGNQVILGTGMASVRRDGDDLAVRAGRRPAAAPRRAAVRRRPQRQHRGPRPGARPASRSTPGAGSSSTPSGGPAARGSSPPVT